jgi:DNA-directed RNA polymerase specialized sigma24 family protein
MSADEDVTLWLERLKEGDRGSVRPLLDRYLNRLVGLAAARLRGQAHLDGCDEDVALSAFKSLCLGAENGRFPELNSRDGLWRLLAVITIRKAIELQRRKRHEFGSEQESLQAVLDHNPTPAELVEMSDCVERLLLKLGDDDLRRIAIWKVEGYTNEEIASRLNCVVRTVERKVHLIRLLWQSEAS